MQLSITYFYFCFSRFYSVSLESLSFYFILLTHNVQISERGAVSMCIVSNASVITGLISVHSVVEHQLWVIVTSYTSDGQKLLLRRQRIRLGGIVPGDDQVFRTSSIMPFVKWCGKTFGIANDFFGYVTLADVHYGFGDSYVSGRVYSITTNTSQNLNN